MLIRESQGVSGHPSPSVYGFPPDRFPRWRKYQYEAIESVCEAFGHTNLVMLGAPTGSGKSVISMTVAKELGINAVILVSTKQLAKQYIDSLGDVAFIIEGRNNYPCILKPGLMADQAPCTMGESNCPARGDCPYLVATRRAASEPIVVTNYPYFLYSQNYGASMNRQLLVLDEAHRAEGALMSFISASLNKKHLASEGISWKYSDYFSVWKRWADDLLPEITQRFNDVRDLAKSFDWQHAYIERLQRLKSLKENLEKLSSANDSWIISNEPRTIQFRPVWVSDHVEVLFGHGTKYLLMSATLPFPRSLGIKEYEEFEVPSTFPVRNRPFIFEPTISLNYKNIDHGLYKVCEKIKPIANTMAEYKGIIHVASYRQRDIVLKHLGYDSRLITHEYNNREEVFDEFVNSPKPLILVSPSMSEGVSFDHDLSRWQIIAKLPWLNRGDEQVAARAAEDRDWYVHSTCSNIVQTYGRIIRSVDDWGTTYCFDSSFGGLYQRNKDYFPNWFREAVIQRGG